MVGHRGSSAGLYLADPTSPIPSHCASIVVTSTLRVNKQHKTPNLPLQTRMTRIMNLLLQRTDHAVSTVIDSLKRKYILALKVLVTTVDALGHF